MLTNQLVKLSLKTLNPISSVRGRDLASFTMVTIVLSEDSLF